MATLAAEAFVPDLLNPDTFADGPPHQIFDRLRREDPIYGQPNQLNGGIAWSLTRFNDIRAISTDTARFTVTEGMHYPTPTEYAKSITGNIMYSDAPQHTRLRSFAMKAFSPVVVGRFSDWIRELCVKIVDNVQGQDRLDMIPAIAAELPAQVIASIMGVPDHERHLIVEWATGVFGRLEPEIGMERAIAAVGAVREYALELRDRKRREPGVDMATELLDASFGGQPITEGEYREMVMSLVLAGFETTHTLIAQSLVLMARDEDVRRQVETAPAEQLGQVVEELLRFVSPVNHMSRTATVDFEFGGRQIAKGDRMIMWYTAGNRDPEQFEDPHRFIGTRGRRNHLAFGAGPHFCLGNHLARLEGEILLDEIRKRGLRLELDGKPERARGIFINALRKVPMRVIR